MSAAAVRDAVPGDADLLGSVRSASWRAAYAPLLPPGTLDAGDNRGWVEATRERIQLGERIMTVAEIGGTVVGYCMAGPGRDSDTSDLHELYAIYVHPAAWSSGAGRALMDDALRRLSRPVVLWTLRDNARARRFYEIAGFRADGCEQAADIAGISLPEVRYRLD